MYFKYRIICNHILIYMIYIYDNIYHEIHIIIYNIYYMYFMIHILL